MRNGWRTIQEERAKEFQDLIVPELLNKCDIMAIKTIEGTDSPLDVDCGIDCIILKHTGETQGMAVRVVHHNAYNNFAIKYPREWNYLRRPENLKPEWFLQAFIVNNRLESIGIIRVINLIEAAEGLLKSGEAHIIPTKERDKSFLIVPWINLTEIEREIYYD